MTVLDRLRSIMDEARYRQYARSPTRIYFTAPCSQPARRPTDSNLQNLQSAPDQPTPKEPDHAE